MFFEIHGQRTVVEVDNLRDVQRLIKVNGKKIVVDLGASRLILGTYDTAERAGEILQEIFDAYETGNENFKLPPQ